MAREARSVDLESANPPVSLQKLNVLEEENQRLKALLAKRLRAENSQLQKLLKRFDLS